MALKVDKVLIVLLIVLPDYYVRVIEFVLNGGLVVEDRLHICWP